MLRIFLFVQALEEKDRKQNMVKDQLESQQRKLKQRLDLLKVMAYRNSRGERTISECSSSTISTASTASVSNDEHGKESTIISNQILSFSTFHSFISCFCSLILDLSDTWQVFFSIKTELNDSDLPVTAITPVTVVSSTQDLLLQDAFQNV